MGLVKQTDVLFRGAREGCFCFFSKEEKKHRDRILSFNKTTFSIPKLGTVQKHLISVHLKNH